MASTYSTNLKLELMGTGDQSGTWGDTTNTNLGTLLEQAIVGYETQAITDGADTVLTIANGASSTARNYVLQLTGALTANRNLIVPAIEKSYIIHNATTGGFSVTVKVSGQTGVTVANGKRALVYNNGTDIIEFVNAPVTEAGTQTLTNKTISADNNTLSGIAASSFVLSNASGNIDGAAAQKAIPTGAVVGDTDSQALTNKTISADSNTLSGIAASSFVLSNASGNIDGAAAQKVIPTGVVVGTTDTQTLTGKTINGADNTLTVRLANDVSGTLPVANGGTGATTLTANNVLLGNGTSAFQVVAPGTSGNVLTSNGTTWTSATPAASGGMTLLGTITTTTGSSRSLTGLTLTDYKQLVLVWEGVSINNSSENVLLGTSTADDVQVTSNLGATDTNVFRGMTWVDLNTGIFSSVVADTVNGAPASANDNPYSGDTTITTASTTINVATSNSSFDAGSIRVYGVK